MPGQRIKNAPKTSTGRIGSHVHRTSWQLLSIRVSAKITLSCPDHATAVYAHLNVISPSQSQLAFDQAPPTQGIGLRRPINQYQRCTGSAAARELGTYLDSEQEEPSPSEG